MKYMFLIYGSEQAWNQEEMSACLAESTALCHELNAKGQFLGASPLFPVATARSVRVRNGQRLVTEGPFAETTEQLGGYFLVDVPDLDEAIAIASRIPGAKKGTVEIRPLFHLEELPAETQPEEASSRKKVMLICYDDEQAWTAVGPEVHRAAMRTAAELTHRLDARGQYLSASPLHPVSTATSVRIREGRRMVTDGPFAETREILGGYYLLSVDSVDDAVAIAAQHPGVFVGTVEIREVVPLPGLPQPAPRDFVSSREFPVSRDRLFQAFADPVQLARWWGPEGFRNTFETFDFQPGGEWRFVMHGPNGTDYPNLNLFDAITPSERIAFRHVYPPLFQMTMTYESVGPERTVLRWRMQLESAAMREKLAPIIVPSNEQNFDRLAHLLNSMEVAT